jgi:hypothetical protein
MIITDPYKTYADKLWRLQNLYKIKDKDKKLTYLRFNRVQELMLEDIKGMTPLRYLIIKYRQGGVSTFWLLWWLDETIFTPNTTTGILAHKWDSLEHLWNIIETAYKYMPEGVRPHCSEESAKKLYFDKLESRIFVSLSIRSTAIHNLHISEWCFCKDEEVLSTLGAISPQTNVTGESTGNGIGNDGYLTYMDAKAGDNEYRSRFVPWFIQKEYKLPLLEMKADKIMDNLNTEEKKLQKLMKKDYSLALAPEQVLFRRQALKRLKSLYPQEYPESEDDAFMAAGDRYFSTRKMLALIADIREYLRSKTFPEKGEDYLCFELPQLNNIYVAGADTAEGLHDKSVLKILNVTKRREAFVYRGQCGVNKFSAICAMWCRRFNNAYLGVELNNTGHAVILGLTEVQHYSNLYKEERKKRIFEKLNDKKEIKYGWRTTDQSRSFMISDLKFAIEDEEDVDENNFAPEFAIYDENLLKEGLTFINNNGKYEAETSKFDDDIFATAIAFQMYRKFRRYNSVKIAGGSIGIKIGEQSEASKEFSKD